MSEERCQRPDDVIKCLKLKDDDVVADLGCGAGYFSLKLAPKVAEHGIEGTARIFRNFLFFCGLR
ncbi:MAG: hypothetical protein WB586_08680 [Chthoniobacterales bacterium]